MVRSGLEEAVVGTRMEPPADEFEDTECEGDGAKIEGAPIGFIPDEDYGESGGDPPIFYDGGPDIVALHRADLVRAENVDGIVERIQNDIKCGHPVFVVANDIYEGFDFQQSAGNNVKSYVIHVFGATMDGSKAHIVIKNIDVFFDVVIPQDGGAPVPAPANIETVKTRILDEIANNGIARPHKIETFYAKPVQVFHEDDLPFLRFHYASTWTNESAIHVVQSLGYKTYSDDPRNNYYRKFARERGVSMSSWVYLTKYKYSRGGAHPAGQPSWEDKRAGIGDKSIISPLSAHYFEITPDDIRPMEEQFPDKYPTPDFVAAIKDDPLIIHDRLLVQTWDIETFSWRKLGDLPRPENAEDVCFLICCTWHWKGSAKPLYSVALSEIDVEPDPRWTTIVCGSQTNLLRAFAIITGHMAPDVIAGFNDADYDWPFVMEKARQAGQLSFMYNQMSAIPWRNITEESVWRNNYLQHGGVKITADLTVDAKYLKVPGWFPLDIRIAFRRLYPKKEMSKGSSLNFYLNLCGLKPKAHMPIHILNKIYESRSRSDMRKGVFYCWTDALRCQELQVERTLVNDRREISNLSFVSLFDSFRYADGMRVSNLLSGHAWYYNIMATMTRPEEGTGDKYTGAYVFPPVKGLENRRPVTGLDFSSLYPSLIMAYNLSPEKYVADRGEAERLAAKGYHLHHVRFEYPIGSGNFTEGWFVRHTNERSTMGLYAVVLNDLFNKRAQMKKQMESLSDIKEHIDIMYGLVKDGRATLADAFRTEVDSMQKEVDKIRGDIAAGVTQPDDVGRAEGQARRLAACIESLRKISPELCIIASNDLKQGSQSDSERDQSQHAATEAFHAGYATAVYKLGVADAKQKALKVFMNTFYGEAGNARCPFFLLPLAGGVTSAGQYNIKMVADFVRNKGFAIKYGDTDSIYVSAPEWCFEAADAGFSRGETTKEAYWAEMVMITMRELDRLRKDVNAMLAADNGTRFLNMAYEEVLFPVVFTGKKKYFGIPHINKPNFHPKSLFVRGLEIVKQGQSQLTKDIGNKIMWRAMDVDNNRTLRQIVEDVLHDAVENIDQWPPDHFVRSAAYKPLAKNQSVQRFVARMRVRHAEEITAAKRAVAEGRTPKPFVYMLPDPGERFNFILTKIEAGFSIEGYSQKGNIRVGDRMEYAHVVQALGLPIDVSYYLEMYTAGICARFINYDDEFCPNVAPDVRAQMSPKNLDALDATAQKAAVRYLVDLIKSHKADSETGGTYRWKCMAYKRAYKKAVSTLANVRGVSVLDRAVNNGWVSYGDFTTEEATDAAKTVGLLEERAIRAAAAAIASIPSPSGSLRGGAECTRAAIHCNAVMSTFERLGIAADGSDIGCPSSANMLYRWSKAIHQRRPQRGGCSLKSLYVRRDNEAKRNIARCIDKMIEVSTKYEAMLTLAVDHERHAEQVAAGVGRDAKPGTAGEPTSTPAANWPAVACEAIVYTDDEIAAMDDFRRGWHEMVAVKMAMARWQELEDWLTETKNRRIKFYDMRGEVGRKMNFLSVRGK